MKALRQEPQERYASADALADDLRAFLERRPVHARSGDVWYRARRGLRRRWMPAAAAAFVLASLSTGLYLANWQRVIAERRFGQLRQLSNRIIDLDLAIRSLPGSIEARKRLVSASLEYLEGLSLEARGNLELAQEISDGYWRLARLEGVNAEFNLGDPVKAEENLAKADALIEMVLASRPGDRNALFRSAVIAHDRMSIASDERRGDVLIHARKATERLEAFLRHDDGRHPVRLEGFLRAGDPRESERRGAATLYTNIALAYVNEHLFEEGAQFARRALELAGPLPSAQDIAALSLSTLANALRYEGDLETALSTIRQARQLAENSSDPTQATRVSKVYGPLLREGRILAERDAVNLNRPAEAIEALQKALDLNEEAARGDARDASSRGRIGTVARELGDILRDRNPRRALAVFDLAIRRVNETPANLRTRRERAELLAKSAYPLRRLHRASEAQVRIDNAVSLLKDSKDYPPQRILLGSPVYSVVRALVDHEAEVGDIHRAYHLYEEFLSKILATGPQPETNLQDAARISSVYAALADVSRRAGQEGRASALDGGRLAMWRHWDATLPDNSFVRRQLYAANQRR